MTQQISQDRSDRQQLLLVYGIFALFALLLSLAGGLPARGRIPIYISGVIILLASTWILTLLTWRWLFRSLAAAQHASPPILTARIRRILAGTLTITSTCLVIGGYWDVHWHLIYPVGFGDDFWWRPHQLIYVGLLFPSLTAAGAVVYLATRNRRQLLQNLRAEPPLSLLVAAGIFAVFTALGDPSWHALFGSDLSAWSPPHLIVMFAYLTNMLAILSIYLSISASARRVATGTKALLRITPILCLLGVYMPIIWLNLTSTPNHTALIQNRFSWLFPVLIMAWAGFVGTLALHCTRFPGAATGSGLIAWTFGQAILALFPGVSAVSDASLAALAPLLALDAWYAFRLKATGELPSWISSGVAAAIGGAIPFLLPGSLITYLEFQLPDLPLTLLLGAGAAIVASWEAQTISDFLLRLSASSRTEIAGNRWNLVIFTGLIIALALFLYYFITTASPPIQ